MKFSPTQLPGLVIVEPDVFKDERGFFFEVYHDRKFVEGGLSVKFVQLNHSKSKKGALRGLHFQKTHPQGKLIRVLQGEIFDVGVDVRRGSPTFGRWEGMKVSADSFKELYIPEGFAHGFCVLSDTAEVEYLCTDLYVPTDEFTLYWNDPDLKIDWPVKNPQLSKKDDAGLTLKELGDRLPLYKVPSQSASQSR